MTTLFTETDEEDNDEIDNDDNNDNDTAAATNVEEEPFPRERDLEKLKDTRVFLKKKKI